MMNKKIQITSYELSNLININNYPSIIALKEVLKRNGLISESKNPLLAKMKITKKQPDYKKIEMDDYDILCTYSIEDDIPTLNTYKKKLVYDKKKFTETKICIMHNYIENECLDGCLKINYENKCKKEVIRMTENTMIALTEQISKAIEKLQNLVEEDVNFDKASDETIIEYLK